MKISRSTTINAPLEKLWAVFVDDFVPVHLWMASIKNSTPMTKGTQVAGSPAIGRVAEIGAGSPGGLMVEQITKVDAKAKVIEFDTELQNIKGFNPIIGWPNRVTLEAQGNATKITWEIRPRLKTIGLPLYFPVKKSLGAGFVRSLEEIKAYVETDQPHPRKAKAFEAEAMTGGLAKAAV